MTQEPIEFCPEALILGLLPIYVIKPLIDYYY